MYQTKNFGQSMITDFPRPGQRHRGRPVKDLHAGKYGELTPSRLRGGGGRKASALPATVSDIPFTQGVTLGYDEAPFQGAGLPNPIGRLL